MHLSFYSNAGICRSPAFVIAYIMEKQNCDFQTAFQYVQDKRFCLNPTDPFRFQLKEYEPIFAAREAMMSADAVMDASAKGEKRKPDGDVEEDYRNDNDMMRS
jgi:serine/threonine/tyrosine-interacting protein